MKMRLPAAMFPAILLAACTQAPAPDTDESGTRLPPQPWTIAHRGAAAYAPENTVPAFLMGASQGAEFVELDLQRTRDGRLVVLHDLTLDRTTDVEKVFPDRARPDPDDPGGEAHWWLDDFTLDELSGLDAGAWFAPSFAGTPLPTFDDAIRAVRGKAGLFIELKSPERYPGIEAQMMEILQQHGLHEPGADPATPVVIQSFTVPSIERLAAAGVRLPLHVLIAARDADTWLSDDGLRTIRAFATGISPEKSTLATHASGWRSALALGLPVTPWTFRASTVTGHQSVTAEMAYFIGAGAAGVITDNPDLAPQ